MRIDTLRCSDANLAEYCQSKHEMCAAGVFSSGIYLEDKAGKLIMLHDMSYGSLPFGLAGRDIKDHAKELRISVGDVMIIDKSQIFWTDGTLFANIHYVAEEHAVPLLSTSEWTEFIRREGHRMLADSNRSQLAIFAYVRSEEINRADLEDPFTTVGLAGVQRLERGLVTGDDVEISIGLDGMLGLGRGLTPSYDDFIVGVATTLNFLTREFSTEVPGRTGLCRMLAEKSGRTNKYSAAYLHAASAGGRISVVDDVLILPGSKEWPAAAERLLSIGGSSGADMMSGCVFAARIIPKN